MTVSIEMRKQRMDIILYANFADFAWIGNVEKKILNGLKEGKNKILNTIRKIAKKLAIEKKHGFRLKMENKAILGLLKNIGRSTQKNAEHMIQFIIHCRKVNWFGLNIVKYAMKKGELKHIMHRMIKIVDHQLFGYVNYATKI